MDFWVKIILSVAIMVVLLFFTALGMTLYDKGIWPKFLRGENRIGLLIFILVIAIGIAFCIFEFNDWLDSFRGFLASF